jgi:hypothetical protein
MIRQQNDYHILLTPLIQDSFQYKTATFSSDKVDFLRPPFIIVDNKVTRTYTATDFEKQKK